jgi:isopenicillin-N epimerase
MREQFLLDPQVHYLNHGAFGAIPKQVFDVFMEWQQRIQAQPSQFFLRDLGPYFLESRSSLGALVGANPKNLAYVPNATYAVNLVARSLTLGPGDEVLSTDHEYGACDEAWKFFSHKQGFRYLRHHVPLGLTREEKVECMWQAVTEKTKVLFVSHITSPTAMHVPVEELCRKARERGILTVIDGAHCVGHIPLDLEAMGADFYTSNCHKWLCSPIGSAFLYASPEAQSLIEPLVVSFGWGDNTPFPYGSRFLDSLQWPGTTNVAAYLSVPAAIKFQEQNKWQEVIASCHTLLRGTIESITQHVTMSSPYVSHTDYVQLGIAPLPPVDAQHLHDVLLNEFQVEVPIHNWDGGVYLRISVQGYSTKEDLQALEHGIESYLKRL